MQGSVFVILTVGILTAAPIFAGPVLIDDFSTHQERISATDPAPSQSTSIDTEGGDILGGERDIKVELETPPGRSECEVSDIPETNNLFFEQDSGTGSCTVVWDGDDNTADVNPTGLGSMDLTAGGTANAIELIVKRNMGALADMEESTLMVHTDGTNSSKFSNPLGNDNVMQDTAFVAPMDMFSAETSADGPADFRSVGAVELKIIAKNNLDLQLKSVRAIADVSAKMTAALHEDANGDGLFDPGDTIRYEVTVENPDDGLARPSSALEFRSIPDANTTLNVGSVELEANRGAVQTGNTDGDTTVQVLLDSIDDDERVIVSFDVVINSQIELPQPPESAVLTAQGTISGGKYLTSLLTDDPDVTGNANPTQVSVIERCGNGVVHATAGEQCDDSGESTTCNANCTVAKCTDGILNKAAGEECDDGNTFDLDQCSNTCKAFEGDRRSRGGVTGCSTTRILSDFGLGLLLIVFLCVSLRLRRTRRRCSGVAAVTLAVVELGTMGRVHAQDEYERNYSIERFQLSSDRDGILNVESGTAVGHLNWELGLWFGVADDPLVVDERMRDGRERTRVFVSQRVGGELVAALGLGKRFQLGLQAPLIANQVYDLGQDELEPDSSFGLGSVRVRPKLQLLNAALQGVDLAIVAAITLPTVRRDSYFGETSPTAAAELAVSRRLGPVRLGANAGYRMRENVTALFELEVRDEIFARTGGGYRISVLGQPLDLGFTLALSTAAADILSVLNHNHSELLLGANYQISSAWTAFAGGGRALSAGFGTPVWRGLAGLRYTHRRADEPRDDIQSPLPVVTPTRIPKGCPENPPMHDPDCDSLPDPPTRPANAPEGWVPPDAQKFDHCPSEPGPSTYYGCPEPSITVNRCANIEVSPVLSFVGDTVDLRSRATLAALGRVLKNNHPDAHISIQVGAPGDDRGLAKRRTFAVKSLLTASGVNRGRLAAIGHSIEPEAESIALRWECPVNQKAPCDRIELGRAIEFTANTANIEKSSLEVLTRDVAWVLQAHPSVRLTVEGHTSSQGTTELSRQRARAVADYLAKQGVAASRMQAVGYGSIQPRVRQGQSEGTRRSNQRIEFRVTAGGSCPPCRTVKVGSIQFEPRKAEFKDASFPELDHVVRVLKHRSNLHLRIEVHTRSEASGRQNRQLSALRAATVREYFVTRGIAGNRLLWKGRGASAGRQKTDHQQVEFIVLRGGQCL